MPNEDVMLKNVTSRAALPLIGVAILSPAPGRVQAQRPIRQAVRSEMLVSTTWLERHLNDRDLVVLQVGQDRGQFDSGHIPGSHFVRLDELVEQHSDSLNELPSTTELAETFANLGVGDRSRIVLADAAGGVLAARAYFTLDYLGHGDHAALLDGGLRAWVAESKMLSTSQSVITRSEFHPYIHPEILVTTTQMQHLSLAVGEGTSGYTLLDARPMAEYSGLVNSESVSQAGHIAGSESLYWKKLIRSEENPQLLGEEDLVRQFENAGAGPGKLVVTYCRTGMQSSFTYFVAKYLGYRAAMYDGSVYEWVRTSGNVLVRTRVPDRTISAHP